MARAALPDRGSLGLLIKRGAQPTWLRLADPSASDTARAGIRMAAPVVQHRSARAPFEAMGDLLQS